MNLGIVSRVDLRQAVILTNQGKAIVCLLRARLMDRHKRLRGAVVAGDEVEWDDEESSAPVIENVLPRKNHFSRRASGGGAREQIVASNLDEVLVMAALASPPLKSALLDRVAVAVHGAGLPMRLAFTKSDLVSEKERQAPLRQYRDLGYAVHLLSVPDGVGVGELRETLTGQRTLFVGHSGVGKSTLLNCFQPSLGLRIGEVHPKTGRGRHTTTAALLVRLPRQTEIVDTPGFRSFSPWGVSPEEVANSFPEIRARLGECRFADCGHDAEPDCAVIGALERGEISRHRHQAYLKLRREAEAKSYR